MKLFVVHRLVGGYAREDSPVSDVVGVFTDKEVARQVAVISHGMWTEHELDYIYPGIKATADVYGFNLNQKNDTKSNSNI